MAISSPITRSSFVKPSLFKELKAINVVTLQINKEKKKRFALQKKFDNLTDKYGQKVSYEERETAQETKKGKKGGGRSIFKPVATSIVGGLFGFFKVFLTYKALEWLSKPGNKEAVTNIVKVLFNVFKFVSALVGFGVDNLLTGLSEVLGGDTILERIGGIFKLLTGLFVITRVLRYANILNIFKDIHSLWKKRNVIAKIFRQLGDRKFGDAIKNLFKLTFPKLSALFRRGIGKTIQLTIRKVFGAGALKLVTGLAKKLGLKSVQGLVRSGISKVAGSAAKGIPLVGPFIGLAINLLLGDSIDMALVKMAGAMAGQALGAIAGGAIGALFGGVGAVPGAAIGGFLGNIVGDWLAGSLYGWIKSFFVKPKDPELAVGGIVTQPTRAIVGEAGPEAVVPLNQLYGGEIFDKPLMTMGAGLIGGMNAVISSMGPVGIMVRPFANQLFAPYTREFGTDSYVFTSDLGKSSKSKIKLPNESRDKKLEKILGDNPPRLISSKDSNPRTRYNTGTTVLALLGDIYNSLVNVEFGSGTGGGGGRPGAGGDVGELGGEVDLSSADDQTLLKQLALAEAAGEGKLGMALVINSVLNRKRILDSGKSPGFFGANDKTIRGIIYGGNGAQYQPVRNGSINKQWGEGSLKLAQEALELARDQSKLAAALGEVSNKKFLLGATGFRAGSAFEDASQNVNVTKYGNHYFNTAGNVRMARGGVVNPIPSQNIAQNKGGYAADTGLDILTPVGSRVVSPVSGTIEYAEKGHVRQMGQDANPNMPGMQDQHSVRIRLDNPFTFAGKKVNFFYATHLYQLNSAIANKSNVKISAGDLLGLSGVANNVPHVHVGFVEDRNQNSFLNFQQVRSLLSGAPIQDSQQSPGNVVPGADNGTTVPEADWSKIVAGLGDLYKTFQGDPKTNGLALSAESMTMVQNMKAKPFMSDTYIIAPGTTTIANTTMVTPLPSVDYTAMSYANLDSPIYPHKFNL